jgi:hypothetical protein
MLLDGCETDMHMYSFLYLPVGSFVSELCPKTCDACHNNVTGSEMLPTVTVLPPTTNILLPPNTTISLVAPTPTLRTATDGNAATPWTLLTLGALGIALGAGAVALYARLRGLRMRRAAKNKPEQMFELNEMNGERSKNGITFTRPSRSTSASADGLIDFDEEEEEDKL